jgi:hypothetical protein
MFTISVYELMKEMSSHMNLANGGGHNICSDDYMYINGASSAVPPAFSIPQRRHAIDFSRNLNWQNPAVSYK